MWVRGCDRGCIWVCVCASVADVGLNMGARTCVCVWIYVCVRVLEYGCEHGCVSICVWDMSECGCVCD